MKYKPRFHRTKDGNYQCLYGKGRKTIEGQIFRRSNTNWVVTQTDESFKRLADAKTRWGEWAAEQYAHQNAIPPVPQRRTSSPPLSDTAGSASDADFESADSEPKHIRWHKPPGHVNRSVPENQYLADPFEGKFYDDDGNLTDVGALAEVWAWVRSHVDDLRLGYPWFSVRERLQAHFPNEKQFFSPQKGP